MFGFKFPFMECKQTIYYGTDKWLNKKYFLPGTVVFTEIGFGGVITEITAIHP